MRCANTVHNDRNLKELSVNNMRGYDPQLELEYDRLFNADDRNPEAGETFAWELDDLIHGRHFDVGYDSLVYYND